MKIKHYLFLLGLLLLFTNSTCDRGLQKQTNDPTCNWVFNGNLSFSSVQLVPPGNFMGLSNQPSLDFTDVFRCPILFPKMSSISVETDVLSGCLGTISRTTNFTNILQTGLLPTMLNNLSTVANVGSSSLKMVITIVSGPYQQTSTGVIGNIVWSKTIANPSGTFTFNDNGVFKPSTPTTKKVYRGSNFEIMDAI
jgi:hypothetical protein